VPNIRDWHARSQPAFPPYTVSLSALNAEPITNKQENLQFVICNF
jgi:hypothetical protein